MQQADRAEGRAGSEGPGATSQGGADNPWGGTRAKCKAGQTYTRKALESKTEHKKISAAACDRLWYVLAVFVPKTNKKNDQEAHSQLSNHCLFRNVTLWWSKNKKTKATSKHRWVIFAC